MAAESEHTYKGEIVDETGRSWHVHHEYIALHPGLGVPLTSRVEFTSGDERRTIQVESTGPLSKEEYHHLFAVARQQDRAATEGDAE